MNGAPAIAMQFATLGIATGGLFFLVPPLRPYAIRLILTGAVIASAAAIISAQILSGSPSSRFEEMIVWISATGAIAAIFRLRRLAAYMMVAAGIGFLVLVTMPWLEPVVRSLARNWWLVPAILLVPCAAALIARIWLSSTRDHAHGARSTSSASYFLSQLLDRLGGARRSSRRRNRHIGDIGTTKRSRRGAGPNMI
jgi:hypothetical protein